MNRSSESYAADIHKLKGATTVTVCLPAHNEATTVGMIVKTLRSELVDDLPLVDQIVVLDDYSTDGTAKVARAAGADVISSENVLPRAGARRGKGEALWKSVAAIHSDLIVWIDADIIGFKAHFVSRLIEPLLVDPELVFVKGHYKRPSSAGQGPGGRVTELLARPALSLYFPELAAFPQPLSGEFAARREAIERIPIAPGYGVDVALLIDMVNRYGYERVGQADCGVRVHRNRPLDELGPQALEVLHAILRRAGQLVPTHPVLVRPDRPPVRVLTGDRPASSELPIAWLTP